MQVGAQSREDWDRTDRELLARVARDELDAFRDLFKRYYPRVYAFVSRRLGGLGSAEDTTVEIFTEIWRNARNFEGRSRPSTWIYGIAHYRALAARRAAGRDKRAKVIPVDFETLSRNADPTDAAENLEAREEVRRVREAVKGLPERYRRVIEMAFYEGLAYSEIADRLGVPEATIKTQVARARTRLRRELAQRSTRSAAGDGRVGRLGARP